MHRDVKLKLKVKQKPRAPKPRIKSLEALSVHFPIFLRMIYYIRYTNQVTSDCFPILIIIYRLEPVVTGSQVLKI